MMYNKEFGCNDIKILVNSNNKKVIDDLIDKYDDYYCDNTGNIDYIINYIVGEPPKGAKKYLDCERGDDSYNYITGNENELTVYLPEYNSFKEAFAKRIFTTTFVKMFQEKGYVILHGACVAKAITPNLALVESFKESTLSTVGTFCCTTQYFPSESSI